MLKFLSAEVPSGWLKREYAKQLSTNSWHHLQGSPNMANPKKETFRHAIAVTGWRSGLKGTPFLYTLNLSCPDENWDKYGGMLQQAAATFKLNDPGKVILQIIYIQPQRILSIFCLTSLCYFCNGA